MFIGHYGIAFALKKAYKGISVGLLFIAVQFVDLLWATFIIFGIEKVAIVPGITKASPFDFYYYPYTHSLVGFLFWSALVFLICYFIKNKSGLSNIKFGLILAFAVFSHFLLDIIVHRPDLPVAGSNSYKIGFGLWNHVAVAYIIEALIFIGGAWLYYRSGLLQSRKRKIALIVFTLLLLIMNLINLLGPPPNDTIMIAISGLVLYIGIAIFGFWIDKQKKLSN